MIDCIENIEEKRFDKRLLDYLNFQNIFKKTSKRYIDLISKLKLKKLDKLLYRSIENIEKLSSNLKAIFS